MLATQQIVLSVLNKLYKVHFEVHVGQNTFQSIALLRTNCTEYVNALA